MNSLEIHYIKSIIKKRDSFSHKGDHGHALLIAGHKGYMGAAVIAAKAGLRSGVGLLTVSVPLDERLILQTSLPEAMLAMREDKQYHWAKFSAVGIGPGLGIDTSTEELLIDVLSKVKVPLVLDADAFELFLENGIFDKETAASFKEHILSSGGKTHPSELYRRFRGREPRPDALLKRAGLI